MSQSSIEIINADGRSSQVPALRERALWFVLNGCAVWFLCLVVAGALFFAREVVEEPAIRIFGPWVTYLLWTIVGICGFVLFIIACECSIVQDASTSYFDRARKYYSRAQIVDQNLSKSQDEIGIYLKSAVAATASVTSSLPSPDATPPEHRPEKRIVSASLVFLAVIGVVVVLVGGALAFRWLGKDSTYQHARPLTKGQSAKDQRWSRKGQPKSEPANGGVRTKDITRWTLHGIGFIVLWLFYMLARNKQKSAPHLLEHDARLPIVYCRSFKDDRSRVKMATRPFGVCGSATFVNVLFEDALSDWISRLGPFVAIGAHKEFLPRLGAARTYVDDTVWRKKASGWLDSSRCIVFLVGQSDGLRWELDEIRTQRLIGKTIFLLPPILPLQGWKGLLAKRKLAVNSVLGDLDDANVQSFLSSLDPKRVLGFWRRSDGRLTVVYSSGFYLQDYEFAIRLALYELDLLQNIGETVPHMATA